MPNHAGRVLALTPRRDTRVTTKDTKDTKEVGVQGFVFFESFVVQHQA